MQTGFPNRALHLDFHTMPGVYDICSEFDGDAFAETLHDAGVEYITVFARCNLGFAYYPTKIGDVYPGLERDLLGEMVSSCHKRNIKVAAYFNAGIDHEHALRHRDWRKIDAHGKVYDRVCLNTGYGEYLAGMTEEVLRTCPVDGIFHDCIDFSPCFGVECLEGMRKAGVEDVLSEENAAEYCLDVTLDYRKKIIDMVGSIRPGINIFFNGLPYRLQPTHLELEVLPTGFWGYDALPSRIRYARTLGKPYLTMTGRFHKGWGDFGGLRSFHSLLFDCMNSIANGGGCSIGDHMHPRGKLEPAVYKLIRKVYDETKRLDPWTEGASSVAEMAVLNPDLRCSTPGSSRNGDSVKGAARMMMELKCQFDVNDGQDDISGYKVIILPDNVQVDEDLQRKLEKNLEGGSVIISSAFSGLKPDMSGFALDEYKLDYKGPCSHKPCYFLAGTKAGSDIPDMPVAVYEPGIMMDALSGAEELAKLIRPYSNEGSWDGFHKYLYNPPEKDTCSPALARSGRLIHFSFPLFKGYYDHASMFYKKLFHNCLKMLFSEPLIKTENMPSFGQAALTINGRQCMVHLLSYVPELRGKSMNVIEEPVEVRDITVSLRNDGKEFKKAYLAPCLTGLDFKKEGLYTVVRLPLLKGYQMIVFEY